MRTPLAVFLLLAVAFYCLPTAAAAQRVTGRVLDPDRAPISTAEITFQTEGGVVVLGMVSDREGRFQTLGISAGRYWVMVKRIGYESTQMGPLALSESDSIEVELFMAVDAIPLEAITVTASARPWWEHLEPPALWEFWDRKEHFERLGSGRFYTHGDLKPLGGQAVALAIGDLAPFMFAEAHPRRLSSFRIKGTVTISADGSACYPPVYLDGHLLEGMPLGGGRSEPAVIDDWISLSQIAAVEVYRGASDVPGEFRSFGANCGAVAIWSLRGPPRR